MKVAAVVTGYDVTAYKVYDVKWEYDTVYELKCDTGTYCRPKGFFVVIPEGCSEEEVRKLVDEDLRRSVIDGV